MKQYDHKITSLIKSKIPDNLELAKVLLISQYDYTEEEAWFEVNCTNYEKMLNVIFTEVVKIEKGGQDEIVFSNDKEIHTFTHDQDCCEYVGVEDINGDLNDLIGVPILKAQEIIETKQTEWGSQTSTFYKFATIKGYVTIRWLGESNGHYSESVDYFIIKKTD